VIHIIIAQTKMKRIPDRCTQCKLSYVQNYYDRYCAVTGKLLETQKVESGNKAYVRPKNCPLKDVENWKLT